MSESRRPIKARQTKWADRIACMLAAKGVQPNRISIASIFFALAAGLSLAGSIPVNGNLKALFFVLSIICIQGRLLCNLFDGMVAIEGGFKTKSGAVFNDLPYRIADPVILISLGYAAMEITTAPILGWFAGLLAVMSAYIRFMGVAAGASELFVGPMAKQHRMAVCTVALIIAALLPNSHAAILAGALILICIGCLITIGRRTLLIIRELESQSVHNS